MAHWRGWSLEESKIPINFFFLIYFFTSSFDCVHNLWFFILFFIWELFVPKPAMVLRYTEFVNFVIVLSGVWSNQPSLVFIYVVGSMDLWKIEEWVLLQYCTRLLCTISSMGGEPFFHLWGLLQNETDDGGLSFMYIKFLNLVTILMPCMSSEL